MPQFKSIERLSLILNYVSSNHFPSLLNIMVFLERNDLIPTERTVQRDLKTLRDLCFIQIKYSRLKKGYFIDENSAKDFEDWMHVFEIFNTAKVINETLIKSSSNIDFIDFDRGNQRIDDGILGKILTAVADKNEIKFSHHSFWKKKSSSIVLQPHLLKQYQNRWYVFGCFPGGEFRIFGLERIHDLEVRNQTFKVSMKKPKEAFDNVVGVVYSISDLETVILSYDAHQGQYIKTQPIHYSQKVLIDDENEFRIQLRVKPNYELEEHILKQGERVVVIEPLWLREIILKRMKLTISKY